MNCWFHTYLSLIKPAMLHCNAHLYPGTGIRKVLKSLQQLISTKLVNSPKASCLGKKKKTLYFGTKMQHY